MWKCPGCGDVFKSERPLLRHLESDTRGRVPLGNGKFNDNGNRCPSWPQHQIDYYKEKGLLEEKEK